MDTPAPNLDELRRRIDAIDDRLHDLILERAELVESIAGVKQSTGQPALRPGREAEILRRLLARHRGGFPRPSLVRIWRELLGGMVAMQGRFVVAVIMSEARPGFWDLARDHFGGYLPLLPLRSAADVLSAVGDGRAAVGILPMPSDHEAMPWWPALAGARGQGPRVMTRLPFARGGNARDGDGDALVIGTARADPTGADRTMLVVETRGSPSRARLIAACENLGAHIAYLAAHEPTPNEAWHLIEVDGLVSLQDSGVGAALKPLGDQATGVWAFGSYARPLQEPPK